jgi:hypothetical protein
VGGGSLWLGAAEIHGCYHGGDLLDAVQGGGKLQTFLFIRLWVVFQIYEG